jgi:type II secretory ATPase GspE/PulE/Tfp pilus assembly ATPase PilB-like protein
VANLRTDEHQAAQDGRFRIIIGGLPVDVRVSIIPTYHGENAVLRLLASQKTDYDLDDLGFDQNAKEKLLAAIRKPYGMILATGPTGSGKTTTLYTLLQMLNSPGISIVTLEDPVEYAIDGIEQIQVNPRTNLTFAAGLRSILRQDPNVIMVGEIRDQETDGLAVNTALTGHLVLSTLHTNDAATTLPRLLEVLFTLHTNDAATTVVIGQRLVRKICDGCKIEKQLSEIEVESLKKALPGIVPTITLAYEGKGCKMCNATGYKGRVGIYEVLVVDQSLRDAILQKTSATKLREIAIEQGMVTMLLDGFHKAKQGITTISEILRMFYD